MAWLLGGAVGFVAGCLLAVFLMRRAGAGEKLGRLLNSSDDAIMLLDADGRVELWNRGAELLYGFTAAEAVGQVLPFVPPESRHDSENRIRRALSGARVVGEEALHRSRDGRTIPVLVTHSRVPAAGGELPGDLVIAQDMTAQKRLEFQRRRLSLLEARDRIGMDLHDGAIQELYAVGMGLETVRRLAPPELTEVRKGLAEATVNLNRVILDLRAYILDQRPHIVQGRGLQEELDALLDRVRDEGGLSVEVDLTVADEPPPEVTGQLVHIAAEALSNVLRHSGGRRVQVAARATGAEVTLMIRDDGRGFDPEAVEGKGRLGLRNMRARALSLGGECRVESAPGQGTEVRVRVPLEGEDAAWETNRSD